MSTIRAAGGVLWRHGDAGVEVALVHRPRYDDISLPKGKLHSDEPSLFGAVREVREETGVAVTVQQRLPSTEYNVSAGHKLVDYWAMRIRSEPSLDVVAQDADEVDELHWATPDRALERVSYQGDRDTITAFAATPRPDAVILLIRHAKAGKRSQWSGDDRLRPLEKVGRQQARRLVPFGVAFGAGAVYAADRTRCIQTVDPLGAQVGSGVTVLPELSDEAYDDDSDQALRTLLTLAKPGSVTAVCSQGGAIPGLLSALDLPERPAVLSSRKGGVWVVCFRDGRARSADYYGRPGA
jgi:8-oxo-dGTP diphosphatase